MLRDRIIAGALRPGDKLREERLVRELGVSRSTLREAFRILAHERLAVHRLNAGVFVPRPGLDDLTDLLRMRQLLEPPIVRGFDETVLERLHPLAEAVDTAERAAEEARWVEMITANMHFHERLIGLAGSPRLSATIRGVLAETRLVFHVVRDLQPLFEPYVERNRHIYQGLAEARFEETAQALHEYLNDSGNALRQEFVRAGGWLTENARVP